MLDLLRLLIPRRCVGCEAQLGREVGLCPSCRAELRPRIESHSPLCGAVTPHLVTLGRYGQIQRRAVRALKYAGVRELAKPLGQKLGQGVPQESWQIHGVLAVPIHPKRERERGYNQAELLAREISDVLQVPYIDILYRTRHTAQQAKMSAEQRQHALDGAFEVRGIVPVGTLLLVDDVLTKRLAHMRKTMQPAYTYRHCSPAQRGGFCFYPHPVSGTCG